MSELALGSAALLVLTKEIRVDREALDRHAADLLSALAAAPWAADSPTLSVVAVAIHHYYGAAESIFERVARAFEGPPERSDRWHQHLLDRMALSLDGVRPGILRRDTARALAPVLGFRQFFRHAYAVSFDPRRLELAARDVIGAQTFLRDDLDALENALTTAARGE
jgi:hypothetical protein